MIENTTIQHLVVETVEDAEQLIKWRRKKYTTRDQEYRDFRIFQCSKYNAFWIFALLPPFTIRRDNLFHDSMEQLIQSMTRKFTT